MSHLCSKVLQDGGRIDRCRGTDATVGRGPVLQVPVNTADGELEARPRRPGDGLSLSLARIFTRLASCHGATESAWFVAVTG